jgi:plastocyanin
VLALLGAAVSCTDDKDVAVPEDPSSRALRIATGGTVATGQGASTPIGAAAVAVEVEVVATDNEYTPDVVRVAVGQPVVWVNIGENEHDIIPVTPVAGFGIGLDEWVKDSSYTFAFDEPGSYAYYCSIHGTRSGKGMAGTVEVSG